MAVFNYLIWLLCIIEVLYEIQGKSITTDSLKKGLSKKRCGVQDEVNILNHSRVRRSAVVDGHWNRTTLTYKVVNGPYPSSSQTRPVTLSKERVDELIAKAFAEWAPHCGIEFEPWDSDYGRADIMISFVSRAHGDGEPFDGPGNTLAHADYPWAEGVDVHFDNDETWIEEDAEEDDDVTIFYPIAVHEIGHTLGLHHTDDRDTIMYGYENSHVIHLSKSDIKSIRMLYDISGDYSTTTENSVTQTESTTTEEVNNITPRRIHTWDTDESNTTPYYTILEALNTTATEDSTTTEEVNSITPRRIYDWDTEESNTTPYYTIPEAPNKPAAEDSTTSEEVNNITPRRIHDWETEESYAIPYYSLHELNSSATEASTTSEEVNNITPRGIHDWETEESYAIPYYTLHEALNSTATEDSTNSEEINSITPRWIHHWHTHESNMIPYYTIPEALNSTAAEDSSTSEEVKSTTNTSFNIPEYLIPRTNTTWEDNSTQEVLYRPFFENFTNIEQLSNWLKAYNFTQEPLKNTTTGDNTIPGDVNSTTVAVNSTTPELISNWFDTVDFTTLEELNNVTAWGSTIPRDFSVNFTTPEEIKNTTSIPVLLNSTNTEELNSNWINMTNFTIPVELINTTMEKPHSLNTTETVATKLPTAVKEAISFHYYRETEHYTYNLSETMYYRS